MNKSELVNQVAETAEVSKADATKVIDAMMDNIKNALVDGDIVTLVGFGTFSTRQRKARDGRNPRTGEKIEIKAATVPVFKPGKALKEAVN